MGRREKESDLIKSEPEVGEPDLIEVELFPGGGDGPVLFEPRDDRTRRTPSRGRVVTSTSERCRTTIGERSSRGRLIETTLDGRSIESTQGSHDRRDTNTPSFGGVAPSRPSDIH